MQRYLHIWALHAMAINMFPFSHAHLPRSGNVTRTATPLTTQRITHEHCRQRTAIVTDYRNCCLAMTVYAFENRYCNRNLVDFLRENYFKWLFLWNKLWKQKALYRFTHIPFVKALSPTVLISRQEFSADKSVLQYEFSIFSCSMYFIKLTWVLSTEESI
jgi:hypothetical protein